MICPTRIDIIHSSVPYNHVVISSLQASARLSRPTNTEEPDVRIVCAHLCCFQEGPKLLINFTEFRQCFPHVLSQTL